MKKYDIKIVARATIQVKAESKAEALKAYRSSIADLEATEYFNLANEGSGWDLDEAENNTEEDGVDCGDEDPDDEDEE